MGRKTICHAKLPVDARYFARGGVGDVEVDAIDKELQLSCCILVNLADHMTKEQQSLPIR